MWSVVRYYNNQNVIIMQDIKIENILNSLSKSNFRSEFHLKQKDKDYIKEKGIEKIREHAYDFINKRLAPENIPNDGKQTPMRGHPVFIAQHATATCCRGCLYKCHKIPKGIELNDEQKDYIVNVIMTWIDREIKDSYNGGKMSRIIKLDKPFILKFEDRKINLPNELKENIERFWKDAVKDNPNLYNGQDYVVETVKETEKEIEMLVVKSDYAHYLYDERVGIKEEKNRCCSPWGGILLLTKDEYFVIGEMNSTTSIPYGLQISGGGIDITDIENGVINIDSNIKRELKEELNLNLDDIDYKIEFIEYPSKTRNAYGFIAIGKIKQTKEELKQVFEQYKEYLIKNNLEIEFNKLIFLKKQSAVKELDELPNYKRPYLRDLIKNAVNY